MSSKGEGGFDARHNFDAAKVAKIFGEEITRALNLSAEALAGGSVDDKTIGISSVLNKHDSSRGTPSPRGGPPGVDTGMLRDSFRTKPAKQTGKSIRVVAGSDNLYGVFHEFGRGTRTGRTR